MASNMNRQSSMGTILSESTNTDSSRMTLSSKSIASSVDEKKMDLTKDNVASPIDLECSIQSERITKILDEAIYKCKLAICLPEFVSEYRMLSSVLSAQHMDDLVFIFEQYDNPLFSASLLNVAIMDELRVGNLSLKTRLNPELSHLIYILRSYPDLRPKVDAVIEKKQKEHLSDPSNPSSRKDQPALEFLSELERFRELMVKQMETTAAEELAIKLNTKKLENSNEVLLSRIKEHTATLKEESSRFEETMALKGEIINRLEHELALLNQEATVKLKKKILDSERQMVLSTRAHAIKKEMLKEEEVETREAYQQLLHQHLIEEKNQRARRFKVETQLLSWLQKYDVEMGDKQLELDEFTEKYESEVQQCEELEQQLAEQDKEYIPLMAEREEEYHREMTEKMEKFLLEHAARVIQHAWRQVLANRAEKKKLKKLQKKMQAEAAAEARRLAIEAKKLKTLQALESKKSKKKK